MASTLPPPVITTEPCLAFHYPVSIDHLPDPLKLQVPQLRACSSWDRSYAARTRQRSPASLQGSPTSPAQGYYWHDVRDLRTAHSRHSLVSHPSGQSILHLGGWQLPVLEVAPGLGRPRNPGARHRPLSRRPGKCPSLSSF